MKIRSASTSVIRIAILVAMLSTFAAASTWKTGDQFPVSKLNREAAKADATIVVFMPSATAECEYASMLTQSFYYYFDQKLAFENLKLKPHANVVLVVGDADNPSQSKQNLYGGMTVVFDPNGDLFKEFRVAKPASKMPIPTVFLLDRDDRIAMIDEKYRAQGEHLKPLEHKLRQIVGAELVIDGKAAPKPLRIGDKAPDFRVMAGMLSDLRGSVVLLSFYPAAFSGVIPRQVAPDELRVNPVKEITLNKVDLMSCTFQIDGIDLSAKADARRIVISSSTWSLLDKWKELLATNNVEYGNDPDYSIAKKYASLDPAGYHRRVSVVIGSDGRVKYIDMDFEESDEALIESKIEAELAVKSRR